MKLTEQELKEARLASLKDKRLSEWQTKWIKEAEKLVWIRLGLKGDKLAEGVLAGIDRDIKFSELTIDALNDLINDLEKDEKGNKRI